jgi:hypothetical protein
MMRLLRSEEPERTTLGGLTGALTAHPKEAAMVIGAGGLIWAVRALGLVGPGDSPLAFIPVGIAVLLVPVLLFNLGRRVRPVVQAGMWAQLGLAIALSFGDLGPGRSLAFVVHAVVALFMVAGEPDAFRRRLGMVAGMVSAVAAVLALSTAERHRRVAPIEDPQLGYEFVLPRGFDVMTQEQVSEALTLPPTPLGGRLYGFGDARRRLYGFLVIDPDKRVQLIGGCQALYRAAGGVELPKPAPSPPPPSVGSKALVYDVKTKQGAQGMLACGRPDEARFFVLAVVTMDADHPERVADALERLGAGLLVK